MTRTDARTRLPAAPAALALVVALGLAGCGQGTAGPASGGPATSTPAAPGSQPPAEPGGDGMDSTAPGTPGTPGGSLPAEPTRPVPVPSGLPEAAAMPADPVAADLVLVTGPPGAQQPPVTLTCDWAGGSSGGTHPRAEQACADLLAAVTAGSPFAPVPPDTMCTQQYGGDAVVEVSGSVRGADGAPVDVAAVYTLTDGCEISRFEAMGAVLAPFRGDV